MLYMPDQLTGFGEGSNPFTEHTGLLIVGIADFGYSAALGLMKESIPVPGPVPQKAEQAQAKTC